ncbi:MAG: acyl-CoA synthetase FdrA [Armatimonadota bacterium]|nr:acyl-CoA synthetase FdrA [Armatimonadota bacterium]MDR7449279.1 acyl-CoA synthetase FdrA [Armatimonadota bacterium]MDR7459657.1 acyl-CoA synthetase FdrA [Armatimonadota bacterium]MDR7480597.1 acyl-CoA synthetase FdrA [Armatimonadota bacterium]MDR7488167.1 acyl-CoA synthetase FdrA [Armatimonadota bacterium]
MVVRSVVRHSAYADSVTLMRVQQEVRRQAGVEEAGLVLATEANKALLQQAGLLTPEASTAGPDDLVIAVRAVSEEAAARALAEAQTLLSRPRASAGGDAYRPRTLAAARRLLPQATVAAVSVPGRFAAGVAREALREGLHVFLFSDNVPLEEEVALKREAAERGLLVMGPDCGTALLGGVGLGFANRVRRGPVGIVAASGTGLQEVASLVHRWGSGVSQAIGTGGRDVSGAVGGATMVRALGLLADDPATRVIVLVSKPPDPTVAERVLAAARGTGKPVVAVFVGAEVADSGTVSGARTLAGAARRAVLLAEGAGVREAPPADAEAEAGSLPEPLRAEAARLASGQRFVRGLYSGGTLCAEAQAVLRTYVGRVRSNAPLDPADALPGTGPAVEHTLLDLGADEFTQGRLHPLLDPTLRLQRLAAEAADPAVAVLLLDVVLGDAVEPDPAARLGPAIAQAREEARRSGRTLCVLGSVCGTELDPQDAEAQTAALREAGMHVLDAAALAAHAAGQLLRQRGVRDGTREVTRLAVPEGAVPPPDPGPLRTLLQGPPAVVNVGLGLFAESLARQGARVIDLDWRPPAGGRERWLELLDRLEA